MFEAKNEEVAVDSTSLIVLLLKGFLFYEA